jgi:hypothetical protein
MNVDSFIAERNSCVKHFEESFLLAAHPWAITYSHTITISFRDSDDKVHDPPPGVTCGGLKPAVLELLSLMTRLRALPSPGWPR